MNKKIKIIDVINKIANGEVPKAIKYHNKIYKYVKNEEEEGYLNADFGGDWLINIIPWDNIKELNQEVEILEDNTEEIEEIELIGTNFMDMDKNQLKDEINKNRIFINKLRQEIFELRKDKNND